MFEPPWVCRLILPSLLAVGWHTCSPWVQKRCAVDARCLGFLSVNFFNQRTSALVHVSAKNFPLFPSPVPHRAVAGMPHLEVAGVSLHAMRPLQKRPRPTRHFKRSKQCSNKPTLRWRNFVRP